MSLFEIVVRAMQTAGRPLGRSIREGSERMVMSGLQGVSACPSCGSPCLVYREYLTPELRTTSCMTCGVVSLTVS